MKSSNKLYGLESQIEQIYNYCKVFLDPDKSHIAKLSQLSVYPTFLFDGYPGTGKSSVATIIYEKLKQDFNIDIKRFNIDELISHNFGESSSNLREYFKKLKEEIQENDSHYFIIMDEVDSFTISRYQHDNESIKRILLTFNTIIDELIRTDEIYRYIFIATTNVKESIDTSILRRFYFKEDFNIELDSASFKNFFKELCDLADLHVEDSFDTIYQIYTEKKYTLGEVKSIISHIFIENLISKKGESINANHFKKNQTFYEVTQQQK